MYLLDPKILINGAKSIFKAWWQRTNQTNNRLILEQIWLDQWKILPSACNFLTGGYRAHICANETQTPGTKYQWNTYKIQTNKLANEWKTTFSTEPQAGSPNQCVGWGRCPLPVRSSPRSYDVKDHQSIHFRIYLSFLFLNFCTSWTFWAAVAPPSVAVCFD